MEHNEIVSVLEDLVPEINRTKNPQGVLIKYANENNLSPAQLEKMGQIFNIVRTLSFMEKSANRGGTFPLLDVPKMVAEYTAAETNEPTVKSASSNINVTASERFPINFLRLSKGWQVPSEEPAPIEKEASAEPEYSETDINNIDQIAFEYEEKYREKIASIVNLVLLGELDFEDFEKSARALYPEIEDVVFDTIARKLSGYRSLTIKRASAMKGLAADITGKAELAKEAYEALEMVRGAHALKKSAAVAGQGKDADKDTYTKNDPNQNPPPSPKRNKSFNLITVSDSKPNLTEKSQSPSENILDTILDSTEGAGEAISLIGKAKDKNKKQKYLDDVMANTHAAANIQRLLITDPVISKADPETVISLAASLGAQNPSTISDINILRTVLREALQYEGVPLHTYKDLVGMRKEELSGDKLERENEDARYGGSSRKDK
jgi:hypothetical protein